MSDLKEFIMAEETKYSRKCESLHMAMALSYAMKPKERSYERARDMNMRLYDRVYKQGRITAEECEYLKQENIWAYNKITHKEDK